MHINIKAPNPIRQISEISSHSYHLLEQLTQAQQDATYAKDGEDTILHISGESVRITPKQRLARSETRGVISENTAEVIHDLMYDSLVHLNATQNVELNAYKFFSAFVPGARWKCTTATVDDPDGEIADHDEVDLGMTPPSVFLRYRFPLIRFEWFNSNPMCELRMLQTGDKYTMHSSWSAWATLGTFDMSPLVARGVLKDTIEIVDGRPLISHRLFCIERITQPEYFKPQALLQNRSFEDIIDAELQKDGLFMFYDVARKILRKIRSSQSMLASSSVVGFSALLASLQPIILQYSEAVGIIMATIGSLSAMIGMAAMVMTNVSKVVELAAAAQGIVANVHAEIEEGHLVEVVGDVVDAVGGEHVGVSGGSRDRNGASSSSSSSEFSREVADHVSGERV